MRNKQIMRILNYSQSLFWKTWKTQFLILEFDFGTLDQLVMIVLVISSGGGDSSNSGSDSTRN